MPLRKIFFTFCSILILAASAYSQASNAQKVKALNNYITFSNECTHGLLIVHRLLENFNKNINKYVDLPDQKINFYTNKDLPEDIFQDPENWFYEVSPNELYKKAIASSSVLSVADSKQLEGIMSQMKSITTATNKLRFDLEEMIQTLDLTKRENLSLVYEKLEIGVKLYKDYYLQQIKLEEAIQKSYKGLKVNDSELQFPVVLNSISGLYEAARENLEALYHRNDDNIEELISKHEKALKNFESVNLTDYNSTRLVSSKIQLYWNNIKKQSRDAILSEKQFFQNENIAEEYKLYDKYYYYYNLTVINKFNRYGSGVVFEMNRILEYLDIPALKYFEMPHYFKVIYPKILEKTDVLTSSDPVVKALPRTVKGRDVIVANQKIYVDNLVTEFDLYDHKIIDGDIVSISFNGDWILANFKISEIKHRFKIKLNESGKNFLLLHADDMGRNPPATIALAYTLNGKKELVILNSDINTSEVIEIILQESSQAQK
ncbi:MAG: hypothetical protein IPM42_12555 [Saprospiraceae bacterium]|nr:hypothetical protein [Saprospiraceae bacterium]